MRHHGSYPRVLLALVLLSLAAGAACAQAPNLRMQRVLARFVEQTGHPMMGVGSWISGKGFDAATSDFDMRLVWPGGGTRAQQLADWRAARTQMIGLIKQEFGDEATSILQRTNLYAPNQLMRGVENPADALERFMALKTAPNLAHTGPITPENFRIRPGAPILDTKQFTEGLYGSGSQTYVQAYERGAGRLFYANNGRCVTGLSELAHMGEGAPIYTSLGTANTAGQWADHGLNELRARQPSKVVKYLERLERDLAKCRSLNGMELNDPLRGRLKSMRDLLKKSPEKLAEVSDDVALLLRQSQAQAALLKNYANAGPLRRAYLRVLLDGVALKSKLGVLLGKVMAKTPDWVTAENTVRFLVLAIATKPAAESLGRGDGLFETMSNVCGAMKPLTLVGPALLAEVMAEVVIQARAGGADMAAGFQGAWNLMEGIYSAWGRADVDPDPRMKLTLADLVANYQYEAKLRERVMTHATRASTRDLGAANATHDQGVANAIFAQCWPTIRDAWRWERDTLASEYLQLASEVVHTPLLIHYQPHAPAPGERIVCDAVSADQQLGQRLERMKQLIRILYGKGSGLGLNYYWTPEGQSAGDLDRQRAFTFPTAGTYPVKVRMEVLPFTTHTETEPRVVRPRQVEALVDVVVGGEPKVAQPPATPPASAARPAAHVLREASGQFGFSTGVDFHPSPLNEGRGEAFTMKLTQRRQLVLRPVGSTPPPLRKVAVDPQAGLSEWRADLNPIYAVPAGVPYHFGLNLSASFADKVFRFEPVEGHACHVTFAAPRFQIIVSRWDPARNKTTQTHDTGAFQMDHTFVANECFIIAAYAIYDFTVTVSSPGKAAWDSKQTSRQDLGTIELQVF